MENSQENPGSTSFRFVSFMLDGDWYGQDIRYIHEVNKVQEITEMPGMPEYILGVMNLRGKIVPIMDLRRRLDLPPKEIDDSSRIIVVEYDGSLVGILVDQVYQVMEVPLEECVEPPPSIAANRFINSIGKLEDRLIFFLDLERVFEGAELEENEGAENVEIETS